MKAFFVHDPRKALDHIVIPELDALVRVDRPALEDFIGVTPRFDQWKKAALNGLSPLGFGRIIATRDDQGDVCIEDADLWRQRMQHYLG